MRYPSLDVLHDRGVDGYVESVGPGRIVVTGDWSDMAGLILRPDASVVVLTRAEYEQLISQPGPCADCG